VAVVPGWNTLADQVSPASGLGLMAVNWSPKRDAIASAAACRICRRLASAKNPFTSSE
jgi:hypothetical protein